MKKLFFISILTAFIGVGCSSIPKARNIQSLTSGALQVELNFSSKEGTLLGKKVKAFKSDCRTIYRRGTESLSCIKSPIAEGVVVGSVESGISLVEFPGSSPINTNTEFELK